MKSIFLRAAAFSLCFLSVVLAQKPAVAPIDPAQAKLDQTITGLDGPGFAIAASDEFGITAAAGENGSVQYWDKDVLMGVRVGERTPNVLKGHQGPVLALSWSGSVLASGGADQKILLRSMPTGKTLHSLPAGTIVRSLVLSPDGKLLASCNDDFTVQLWDVAAGKPDKKLAGHTDWPVALAFSADGKQLASGGYDGTVRLWDVAGGKKLLDITAKAAASPKMTAPDNTVLAVAFSPDGKQIAAGGTDAQVHLFNTADGKLIRSLPGHTGSVSSLVYHPGGTLLVSGSKDRSIRLWNPVNGQMLKSLEGHTAWVQGVCLTMQGTRLASVGADQTVRLWELVKPAKK